MLAKFIVDLEETFQQGKENKNAVGRVARWGELNEEQMTVLFSLYLDNKGKTSHHTSDIQELFWGVRACSRTEGDQDWALKMLANTLNHFLQAKNGWRQSWL